MGLIDIHIRFSDKNMILDKATTLNIEKNLIYKDESNDLRTHQKTTLKFAILTMASPLIAITRLVRSAVFVFNQDYNRAKREFIGALTSIFITSYCFVGSFLSNIIYIISSGNISFYVQMRRTYAYFEAWVNKINLQDPNLASFSQRISNPTNYIGNSNSVHKHVWTTAPCMQPVLEKGLSNDKGIFDIARMRKIFPLIKINDIKYEDGKIVIQSEYADSFKNYKACNGAFEHSKTSTTCCCHRIETVYDRFLCCSVGKGSCTSIANSGNSCGIAYCSACGVLGCCCYEEKEKELIQINGCLGIEGLSLLTFAI